MSHRPALYAALFVTALAGCDRSPSSLDTEPAEGVTTPSESPAVSNEEEPPTEVEASTDEPAAVGTETGPPPGYRPSSEAGEGDNNASALDAFVPRPETTAQASPAPTADPGRYREQDMADSEDRGGHAARAEVSNSSALDSLGADGAVGEAFGAGGLGTTGTGRGGGGAPSADLGRYGSGGSGGRGTGLGRATGTRTREAERSGDEVQATSPFDDARSVLQPIGNTNINLGGAQDFGLFRRRLDDNQVPRPGEYDAAGFFAEHHTPLPPPSCGERVCLQPMLGVMANLHNGEPMTILQLGLNSPIEAVAAERPPLTLSVVVDVSGSMESAGKIDFVRQGLELLIDSLHDGDQIAIITYSNRAQTLFEMSGVSENRTELRRIARSLTAHGGTNLYDGLEEGYREVADHYDSGRQNRVILLSDGQPTSGNTSTSAIWNMSERYNSEGVGLTTIGLGSSFNVDLMRGLSERGDGNFYFVEDAGAVTEVFTDEVSFFTVPVAFDLELDVEMGSHYEITQAHGSSNWEASANGGTLEQESVFLAHRESHADVTDTGGRRGGGSALILELQPRRTEPDPAVTSADVATVHVSFREPGTNRIVEDTVVVHYPGSPWSAPTTGYFYAPDPSIIQKSFLMLGLYQAMDYATSQFYAGNRNQAVGTIRRAMAAARDFNDSANGGGGDVDVALDLQLMQQLIDVLYRNGAAEPVALRLPQDPWPADRDM